MQINAWLRTPKTHISGTHAVVHGYFWTPVANKFNATTPINRFRLPRQCRDKWHKLNGKIHQFNSSWCIVRNLHGSGQTDDELVDRALQLYRQQNGKSFTQLGMWQALRNQPDWNKIYEA